MPAVFKKLGLKAQKQVVVVNAPESFEPELAGLGDVEIVRDPARAKDISLSLAFVTTQKDVDTLARAIARKAQGDSIVWFAYPKGSSKRYKSEINRDQGWLPLGREGFEPVSMVAIDEDWSAVRFRRLEFIKQMKRPAQYRLTDAAKLTAAKK
jgi:hypothetical protein